MTHLLFLGTILRNKNPRNSVSKHADTAHVNRFGFVFSALAETGQAHLTFYVNAAVAVVGMAVLYLSHFPPLDSTMVEDLDWDEDEAEEDNRLTRVISHETDR